MRVSIGSWKFPTKGKAEDFCRAILKTTRGRVSGPNEQFLYDLIRRHPEASRKIGAGIDHFAVDTAPDWGGRCFWVHRVDTTCTDFSYRACITPPKAKHDAISAFRDEVQDQIRSFRDAYFDKTPIACCPLTGGLVTRGHHHVDHLIPFKDLVSGFLAERGLILDEIVVLDGTECSATSFLKDRSLAADWSKYHELHASLRVTTPFGNLSRPRK